MYSDLSSGFGLFGVDVEGVCQKYNKTEGAHSAAKGFGILTSLALGSAVISSFLASCRLMGDDRRLPATWSCSRILYGIGLVSSLFTMLMYAGPYKNRVCQENGDCKPGLGAGLNIANILLLSGLSLLSCFTSAPPLNTENEDDTAEFEAPAEQEPDVEAQEKERALESESDENKSYNTKAQSETEGEETDGYSKVDNEVVGTPSWNPCNACLH